MSKLKFAMAMIAAGGAAGVAAQANAAIVVETFNYAAPTDGTAFSYDVTLAGALSPQFTFHGGAETGMAGPAVKHYLTSTGTGRLSPNLYFTNDVPASTADVTQTEIKSYSESVLFPSEPGGSDSYYHLTFDAGAQSYKGTVFFDADHTLRTITYTELTTAAVPEPSAWALMILGTGLAGAAVRRQRQRQLARATA